MSITATNRGLISKQGGLINKSELSKAFINLLPDHRLLVNESTNEVEKWDGGNRQVFYPLLTPASYTKPIFNNSDSSVSFSGTELLYKKLYNDYQDFSLICDFDIITNRRLVAMSNINELEEWSLQYRAEVNGGSIVFYINNDTVSVCQVAVNIPTRLKIHLSKKGDDVVLIVNNKVSLGNTGGYIFNPLRDNIAIGNTYRINGPSNGFTGKLYGLQFYTYPILDPLDFTYGEVIGKEVSTPIEVLNDTPEAIFSASNPHQINFDESNGEVNKFSISNNITLNAAGTKAIYVDGNLDFNAASLGYLAKVSTDTMVSESYTVAIKIHVTTLGGSQQILYRGGFSGSLGAEGYSWGIIINNNVLSLRGAFNSTGVGVFASRVEYFISSDTTYYILMGREQNIGVWGVVNGLYKFNNSLMVGESLNNTNTYITVGGYTSGSLASFNGKIESIKYSPYSLLNPNNYIHNQFIGNNTGLFNNMSLSEYLTHKPFLNLLTDWKVQTNANNEVEQWNGGDGLTLAPEEPANFTGNSIKGPILQGDGWLDFSDSQAILTFKDTHNFLFGDDLMYSVEFETSADVTSTQYLIGKSPYDENIAYSPLTLGFVLYISGGNLIYRIYHDDGYFSTISVPISSQSQCKVIFGRTSSSKCFVVLNDVFYGVDIEIGKTMNEADTLVIGGGYDSVSSPDIKNSFTGLIKNITYYPVPLIDPTLYNNGDSVFISDKVENGFLYSTKHRDSVEHNGAIITGYTNPLSLSNPNTEYDVSNVTLTNQSGFKFYDGNGIGGTLIHNFGSSTILKQATVQAWYNRTAIVTDGLDSFRVIAIKQIGDITNTIFGIASITLSSIDYIQYYVLGVKVYETTISTNGNNHYAMTFDNGNIVCYINGVIKYIGLSASTEITVPFDSKYQIGQNTSGHAGFVEDALFISDKLHNSGNKQVGERVFIPK